MNHIVKIIYNIVEPTQKPRYKEYELDLPSKAYTELSKKLGNELKNDQLDILPRSLNLEFAPLKRVKIYVRDDNGKWIESPHILEVPSICCRELQRQLNCVGQESFRLNNIEFEFS